MNIHSPEGSHDDDDDGEEEEHGDSHANQYVLPWVLYRLSSLEQ